MDPFVRSGTEPAGAPGDPARSAHGVLSSLDNAAAWLNSPPLTEDGLRGRIVLVQFWTYTCINWLRTMPHIRAWDDKYRNDGFVVIGVHTPEFDFEHELDNVRRGTIDLRIDYPVAVDSIYRIWNGFDNHYWPAQYLLDARGQIRHHRFGEGDYERFEQAIAQLVTETGAGDIDSRPVDVDGHGLEAPVDWDSLRSGENYVGFNRAENFASRSRAVLDARRTYELPRHLRLNHWALSGDWTVRAHATVLNQPGGLVAYRFHARDLHLVMGPAVPGEGVRFRVTIDGHFPATDHGDDIDDRGDGAITAPRLYQLIRQSGPIDDRTFEITFLDAGARVYAFTFG